MPRVLIVHSAVCARADAAMRALSDALVDRIRACHADAVVCDRELATAGLPHVGLGMAAIALKQATARNERERALFAVSTALVDELLRSDVVVIEAPIHNLGLSSTLCSWIDFVSVPGRTFAVSHCGPLVGLVDRRRIFIVSDRCDGADAAIASLRLSIGALGMRDARLIAEDWRETDPDRRSANRRASLETIRRLIPARPRLRLVAPEDRSGDDGHRW